MPISLAQVAGSFAIIFSILSNGLAQSNKTPSSTTSPVVFHTGYEIIPSILTPSLHWIDNGRLLFVGMKAGRGPRPDARKLYLWDASTKSVKLHADARTVCVVDGIVRYQIRLDKETAKAFVRQGPLGSERDAEESLPSKEELSRNPRVHNDFTCKSHVRSDLRPVPLRDRDVVVLRDGDGYLDLGPNVGADLAERRAQPRNLVLYQANRQAFPLPMTWDEQFSQFEVAFSAFRKAYVLQPHAPTGSPIGLSGTWPKGQPLTVYLLWADGKSEKVSIPHSISNYYLRSPRPTVGGWILGGGTNPSTVGLYAFDGKVALKLDVGSVKEATVTSDGCKAAVAIQNEPLEMGTPTNLKIFDFCAGGR